MRIISIFILSFLLMACSNTYYEGAKSDHFDGKTFSSLEPISGKSFFTVLKWRLTADRQQWPAWIENAKTDKPVAKVQGTDLRVTFVNHSTVLLQTEDLNILIDPVWSDRVSPFSFMGPKRVHAPGIAWNDLPKIDVVLISHAHYDHLDIPTVRKLSARDNPVFVVPLGVDTIIKKHDEKAQLHVMDWYDDFAFNENLKITSEPVQHWSARSLTDRNRSLWAGYVLQLKGGKIYYSGDTGYGTGKVFKDTFARHGKMRFAIIPIAAYEPRWFMKESHVNPDEAVKIFKDVGAENALGVHFGTFQLSDEAIDAPVKDLKIGLDKANIETDKFRTLKPGEVWVLK